MARRLPSRQHLHDLQALFLPCGVGGGDRIERAGRAEQDQLSAAQRDGIAVLAVPAHHRGTDPRGNGISIEAPPCTGIFRHKLYAELV